MLPHWKNNTIVCFALVSSNSIFVLNRAKSYMASFEGWISNIVFEDFLLGGNSYLEPSTEMGFNMTPMLEESRI